MSDGSPRPVAPDEVVSAPRVRQYAVRLTVAGALAFGIPMAVCALTWPGMEEQVPLVAWLALGLLVGAALFLFAASAVLEPLRRAEESLDRYLAAGGAERGVTNGNARFPEAIDDLVDALAQRAALLGELATIDSLTGLPNRLTALDRLRHSVYLAARDELPLTIALVDIDSLDDINEAHGFGLGDKLVAGVGHRLEQLLRGSDWAARWGDDEFLVALFADPDGSMAALDRVVSDLKSMRVVVGGQEIYCTVSVGAVRVRAGDRAPESVARAAAQLVEAKKQGTGSFSLGE